MDWIDLARDKDRWRALVNTVMNWVSQNMGNFLTSWEPVSFSRRTLLHEVSNTWKDIKIRICTIGKHTNFYYTMSCLSVRRGCICKITIRIKQCFFEWSNIDLKCSRTMELEQMWMAQQCHLPCTWSFRGLRTWSSGLQLSSGVMAGKAKGLMTSVEGSFGEPFRG